MSRSAIGQNAMLLCLSFRPSTRVSECAEPEPILSYKELRWAVAFAGVTLLQTVHGMKVFSTVPIGGFEDGPALTRLNLRRVEPEGFRLLSLLKMAEPCGFFPTKSKVAYSKGQTISRLKAGPPADASSLPWWPAHRAGFPRHFVGQRNPRHCLGHRGKEVTK